RLFAQEDIPLPLILFGTGSQVVFTLRFVYQWWYSRRAGTSLLPVTFWAISLTGSLLIIVYAILRRDPVLLLGQGCGALVYARKIKIGCKEKKE
ncbi:MAG: lipid-A-disaccharide synthase N-terminal domain-containing protein, partial [Bacteroidales bacterium]|nr:lipid-A-disaccharide synthase N-terminal domain-containing protein [Bacteroidales bacterium]